MAVQREKFATQMSPRVLSDLRDLAKAENKQIQALLEEAVLDLLDKRRFNQPDSDFMAAAEDVMKKFPETLKYLAS